VNRRKAAGGLKRLAILWLACAAIGFLAAIGAAFALSLALDGDGAWRAQPGPRLVQRKGPAAPDNAAPKPQSFLASVLGSPA
jgi:hypothetical protein